MLSVEDDQGRSDNDTVQIVVTPGIVNVVHQIKSPESDSYLPHIAIRHCNSSVHTITIFYKLGKESLTGKIKIRNLAGQVIRQIPVNGTDQNGVGIVDWDGCSDWGKRMPLGMYICNLIIKGGAFYSEKFLLR